MTAADLAARAELVELAAVNAVTVAWSSTLLGCAQWSVTSTGGRILVLSTELRPAEALAFTRGALQAAA